MCHKDFAKTFGMANFYLILFQRAIYAAVRVRLWQNGEHIKLFHRQNTTTFPIQIILVKFLVKF